MAWGWITARERRVVWIERGTVGPAVCFKLLDLGRIMLLLLGLCVPATAAASTSIFLWKVRLLLLLLLIKLQLVLCVLPVYNCCF